MFFIGGDGMPGGFPGMGKGGGKGFPFAMFGGDDDDDEDEEKEDSDKPKKEVDNKKLYEVLDLEQDASTADVKKAYHKMAMKHHPDKGGDPEEFKAITHAYEVLSDPEQRKKYDKYGEEGLDDDGPSGPQDIFEAMFGGGSRRQAQQQPRTSDVVRPVWVTLEQLYTGFTRSLPITRRVVNTEGEMEPCKACGGKGSTVQLLRMGPMVQQIQQTCPTCQGTGKSQGLNTLREVLDVFVEKGAPDGHKVTFHGKADERPGCEPGNVVAVLKQQDHPRFLRKEADLYVEQEVTLGEALTGFELIIPHLDGRKLVVKSNPGEVLQPQSGGVALKAVAGQGMPIHKDPFQFGNLFLVLSIRFPRVLEPAVAGQLRTLLPAREAPDEAITGADEVEEVYVTDIDPLESSKRQDAGNEAYEEDEDAGMPQVACKQQ